MVTHSSDGGAAQHNDEQLAKIRPLTNTTFDTAWIIDENSANNRYLDETDYQIRTK